MTYTPAENRYERMTYNRCGKSGLKLPAISLGLWHNFGQDTPHATKRAICRKAFDLGITHFDLANNYGPPAGTAEEAFGEILRTDFRGYRDELIISSKAGYNMWPGPYGEWGSRVAEYMRAPVATIDADMPIIEVAQLFAEREYRRYPVLEDARLVGQISRSDVLRALQQLAGGAADLRTSIPPRT